MGQAQKSSRQSSNNDVTQKMKLPHLAHSTNARKPQASNHRQMNNNNITTCENPIGGNQKTSTTALKPKPKLRENTVARHEIKYQSTYIPAKGKSLGAGGLQQRETRRSMEYLSVITIQNKTTTRTPPIVERRNQTPTNHKQHETIKTDESPITRKAKVHVLDDTHHVTSFKGEAAGGNVKARATKSTTQQPKQQQQRQVSFGHMIDDTVLASPPKLMPTSSLPETTNRNLIRPTPIRSALTNDIDNNSSSSSSDSSTLAPTVSSRFSLTSRLSEIISAASSSSSGGSDSSNGSSYSTSVGSSFRPYYQISPLPRSASSGFTANKVPRYVRLEQRRFKKRSQIPVRSNKTSTARANNNTTTSQTTQQTTSQTTSQTKTNIKSPTRQVKRSSTYRLKTTPQNNSKTATRTGTNSKQQLNKPAPENTDDCSLYVTHKPQPLALHSGEAGVLHLSDMTASSGDVIASLPLVGMLQLVDNYNHQQQCQHTVTSV